MPLYIRPPPSGSVAVAVCGRCGFKHSYNDLSPDGDKPGLYVCGSCQDTKDPYKLPARRSDRVTLRHPRPDEPLE